MTVQRPEPEMKGILCWLWAVADVVSCSGPTTWGSGSSSWSCLGQETGPNWAIPEYHLSMERGRWVGRCDHSWTAFSEALEKSGPAPALAVPAGFARCTQEGIPRLPTLRHMRR